MEKQNAANAYIRIGRIFSYDCADECGSSYCYYQVVGLRGKALVELRKIQRDAYMFLVQAEDREKFLNLHGNCLMLNDREGWEVGA